MANLADIPPVFLSEDFRDPFVEWLKLLPTTKEQKTRLLALWAEAATTKFTQDELTEVTTKGLIVHGS
jgi:hypothetical protein